MQLCTVNTVTPSRHAPRGRRIVLPKPLRDRFRLGGGTKLRIEAIGDHLELTPELSDTGPAVARRKGLLVVPATGVPCDAREAIEAERRDRESDPAN